MIYYPITITDVLIELGVKKYPFRSRAWFMTIVYIFFSQIIVFLSFNSSSDEQEDKEFFPSKYLLSTRSRYDKSAQMISFNFFSFYFNKWIITC